MGFQRIGLGLIASTLVFPLLASATVTLQSYSQYLPSVKLTPDSEEITMYAGRTSRNCTASNPSFTNTGGTCDSCAKDNTAIGSTPCNSREIYPELPFTITLSSDSADDYKPCSRLIIGRRVGGDDYFVPDTVSTYAPNTPGQSVTATFSWSTICGKADGGDSNCNKSFNSRFEFGFDGACSMTSMSAAPQFNFVFRFVNTSPPMSLGCPNSTGAYDGICNYTIFPGDEKVFVKDPQVYAANEFYVPDLSSSITSNKDTSGMKYSHFRVYYKPGRVNGPTPTFNLSDPFKDLAISGTKLTEERVTGLTNGTDYVFLGAMVDQAGNVTHFAPPGSLQAAQEGKPEEVYGLLDNKGCFVATAAYGTPQADEIQILRDFRDVSLAHSEWGRSFIRFYYKHSPAWAAVIRENETLRTAVRIALTPVIWTTEKILEWQYGISAHKASEPEAAKGTP